MVIVIIADSLGCPRTGLETEDTWIYKILKEFGNKHVIYTFIEHGLSTAAIKYRTIQMINPDLIITQLGIVDCCRRVLPCNFKKFIDKIPIINKKWKRIASKHHYILTKMLNIHYVNCNIFKENFEKLSKDNPKSIIYTIRIADAGDVLLSKVYNVENDIKIYNKIMEENYNYIDPYVNTETSRYILAEDGHHINKKGHELVFNFINDIINRL